MDPIIFTPRLKLTLVTKAPRGSSELEWFHKIRSDEKTTLWSIFGRSKTIEDTEKILKFCLPNNEGEGNQYRVAYAVHKILGSINDSTEGEAQSVEQREKPTEFIGFVNLAAVGPSGLALPEDLTIPAAAATTTLTVELSYSFLPTAWGKGYAPESIEALFEASKRGQSFWAPFPKLYIRAIVNEGNPASLRVMKKCGVPEKGIYEWTGKPIFLGGEWTEHSSLHIFGKHLLE